MTAPTLAAGTGPLGLTTELVVSSDGCARMSPTPELDVQPAKAMQAKRIAGTPEKRIDTRTQTNTSTARENAIEPH